MPSFLTKYSLKSRNLRQFDRCVWNSNHNKLLIRTFFILTTCKMYSCLFLSWLWVCVSVFHMCAHWYGLEIGDTTSLWVILSLIDFEGATLLVPGLLPSSPCRHLNVPNKIDSNRKYLGIPVKKNNGRKPKP